MASNNTTEVQEYQQRVYTQEELELLGELDKPRTAWRPEVGDRIVGKVNAILTIHGTEYGDYQMVELDCGAEIIQLHAFHTVLANAIERNEVVKGDMLAVSYTGRDPENRDMALYRVAVKHSPTTAPQTVTITEEPF